MTDYRMTKLFLTAVEHGEAQADLARALRRRTFSPHEEREKTARMGRLLMRCDLLAEEIQELQGNAA